MARTMMRTPVKDLWEAVACHGSRTAVVDGPTGRSITYGELGDRVGAIAGWLGSAGVTAGDHVAFWAPNVPPVIGSTLAALSAGVAITGLNPAATDEEARRQLADAGARVVFTTPDLAPRAATLGAWRVVDLVADLDELLRHASSPPVDVAPGTTALLPYSSGTTGLPKGVVLSHANVAAVTAQLRERLAITADDVTLAVAPFFHILGVTAGLLLPLATGATVVTMPRFEPDAFLDLIERHRVTYLAVPPTIATLLAANPGVESRDLSSLELLVCGGAPLHPGVQERLAARLPGCVVAQGWGLTESTGALTVPDRRAGARPGSVGRPLAGTEIRVIDPDTGDPCANGVDGELQVCGPQVMCGYLGRDKETQAILLPDGWLRTGDLGHVDDDGAVVIVDRMKDLIKVNAFQVAPAEVELALVGHPAVRDAAVVGRPDDRTGEKPVAHIVLADPAASVEEITAWLRSRIAPYKLPAEIHVVAELPRSPAGKLLRRLL